MCAQCTCVEPRAADRDGFSPTLWAQGIEGLEAQNGNNLTREGSTLS